MKLFINLCFLVLFFWTVSANAGEIITVDNRDASVSQTGWWSLSGGQNPNASDSVYSFGASTFTWEVEVAQSSTYDIEVYWTYWANRTSGAKYEVFDPQGSLITEGTFDQKQNGSTWVNLGSETLQPGSYSVTLSTATGGSLSADAVRFVEDDDSVAELVTDINYFTTAGAEQRAIVKQYYTGEVFVFYDLDTGFGTEFQDYEVTQLREHDDLRSSVDLFAGVPTYNEFIVDYDAAYIAATVNVTKNDNGYLLVSWIERDNGDQDINSIIAKRINMETGEIDEVIEPTGAFGEDVITSVNFSQDGSSVEITTERIGSIITLAF